MKEEKGSKIEHQLERKNKEEMLFWLPGGQMDLPLGFFVVVFKEQIEKR